MNTSTERVRVSVDHLRERGEHESANLLAALVAERDSMQEMGVEFIALEAKLTEDYMRTLPGGAKSDIAGHAHYVRGVLAVAGGGA